MSESQKTYVRVGIWITSILTVIALAFLFTSIGAKFEKDACLVRAYENRIDVDLAKKICAFSQNLTQPAETPKQ